MTGTPSKYFNFVKKNVDCMALWANEAIDEGVSDDLPEQYKTCVYRVVQEALNNCARHAGANTVRIIVRQGEDHLMLSIQDDGGGFQPELHRGLGLLGMEERVTHLNGSLELDSEPGRGTLIAISLPLERTR